MVSDGGASNPDDPGRRAGERVAATFRVRFRSLDELVTTYTSDISRGGLFVATDRFIPVGSVVQLKVEVPDGRDASGVLARVAFHRPREEAERLGRSTGMGMEFLDGGSALGDRIAAHLVDGLDPSPGAASMRPADILVVDDSPTYLEANRAALAAAGHRVRTAQNGLEALGSLMREAVDIVLSDVQMPTMDGWQLLRLVRARPTLAHIPFVFITTLSGEAERLRGYQLGVDDYLSKPMEAQELATRISVVLERARRRPGSSAERGALSGDLKHVSLPSVLAFLEAERRTGALLVIADDGLSTLHVVEGRVHRADRPSGKATPDPRERLFEVLDLSKGRFEFAANEDNVVDELGAPTGFFLMEHARRTDERNR